MDVDSGRAKLFSPSFLLEQEQDSIDFNDPSSTSLNQTSLPTELPQASLTEQFTFLKELLGKHPTRQYWDSNEPKILVLELVLQPNDGESLKASGKFGLAGRGRKTKHSQVNSLDFTTD